MEFAENTLSFLQLQYLPRCSCALLCVVLSPWQCRFVKSVMWVLIWLETLENYTLSLLAKHIKCITKFSVTNVLLEVFSVYCLAFGGSFFKLV